MCGIFGTIHFPLEDRRTSILEGLKHRGPGEQHFRDCGQGIGLYHTRLAIQDLSEAGRQPMQYRQTWITFNGEIYNHMELRERFGLQHPSTSDTMTILMLYERMGMDMLALFDGMFALALYDQEKGQVFLARDRAGKKPLYLWNEGTKYIFSSELKVLSAVLRPSIDEEAIADYLYMGFHYRQATPYQGIREIENGTWLSIDLVSGQETTRRWFDISGNYQTKAPLTEEQALEALDGHLRTAIRRRIESSDLEVGAFLSGGIDSGLVTAIAAGCTPGLRTFTVRLPGAYDESALAALVARKYHTRHRTIDISFDHLQDDLVRIVSNYGEPFFDSSAIPSFYVSREAQQHITVVLNGDGADELFGGYRRYVPFRYFDFFKPSPALAGMARGLGRLFPPGHEKKSVYNYVYRLVQFAGYTDVTAVYGGATTDIFTGLEEAFVRRPRLGAMRRRLEEIREMPVSSLSKLLLADFDILLAGDLLPKMDIATMAHSLEGRSPFLSKELLELAPTLNDAFKIRGRTTKYLLRRLAARYLPPELIGQPKRGFEIPLRQWMNGELKDITFAYLKAPGVLYPAFVHQHFVDRLLENKVRLSEERRAKMLYTLLCLEIWYRHVHQNVSGICQD